MNFCCCDKMVKDKKRDSQAQEGKQTGVVHCSRWVYKQM